MPAIDALANPVTTTHADSARTPSDQMGKDTFLKLLVAQLKYQDPLAPADSSSFMAQSAQFTMVEKLEELAGQSAELLASQRALAGSSLLGRQVTYPGPDGRDLTGTVTGVRMNPDGPVLRVGTADVPLASVREVTAPAQP